MGKESNIPFIHSYCDRWCERCPFTNRCDAFALELEQTSVETQINEEEFWNSLMGMFSEAKELLGDKAEELGFDLKTINEENFREKQNQIDELIFNETLNKLADQYSQAAEEVLANQSEWLLFSPLDEDGNREMLKTISWYQNFILVKFQRGLNGIIVYDGSIDSAELNNPQSDANGSAKIGLMAVERSITAWKNLFSKENSQIINPLIALLHSIKQNAETKFPKAKEFIRPGFDEIEMVM